MSHSKTWDDHISHHLKMAENLSRQRIMQNLKEPAAKIVRVVRLRHAQLVVQAEIKAFEDELVRVETQEEKRLKDAISSNGEWGLF